MCYGVFAANACAPGETEQTTASFLSEAAVIQLSSHSLFFKYKNILKYIYPFAKVGSMFWGGGEGGMGGWIMLLCRKSDKNLFYFLRRHIPLDYQTKLSSHQRKLR